jgi:hypothetical protein
MCEPIDRSQMDCFVCELNANWIILHPYDPEGVGACTECLGNVLENTADIVVMRRIDLVDDDFIYPDECRRIMKLPE